MNDEQMKIIILDYCHGNVILLRCNKQDDAEEVVKNYCNEAGLNPDKYIEWMCTKNMTFDW